MESFPHCKHFLLAGDAKVGRTQWKKMQPERFAGCLELLEAAALSLERRKAEFAVSYLCPPSSRGQGSWVFI